MATQNPTTKRLGDQDGSLMKFVWTLTGTDDGAPIPFAEWADRCVQFVGTWGGGTVVLEGSNDGGTTWATLNDSSSAAISKTANALCQVIEVPELVRPRATVSVTSVAVYIVARRPNTLRT